MACRITSNTKIMMIGDSLSIQFTTSVPFQVGWGPLIRARMSPATPVPGITLLNLPRLYVNAGVGRAIGDVSPTIATFIAGMPRVTTTDDVYCFQTGINEAQQIGSSSAPTVNIATMQGQITTVLNAVNAITPKPQILWFGPWAHDSGDLLTQIGQVDVAANALVTAAGGTYVTWSGVPNTGGNSIADGTHPTTQGAAALGAAIMPFLTFA